MSDEKNREWHLDRKVTVALIIAILINAGSGIWWASRITSIVGIQSDQIAVNKKNITDIFNAQSFSGERLARIEERSGILIEITNRLERKLDDINARN